MSKTANLFNIQHFSVNDGPGIRTVVFFKGCPLDCVWCHNPESIAFEPEILFRSEKCTGCGSHPTCSFMLLPCTKEHGVAMCYECESFQCDKVHNMLNGSYEKMQQCRRVCESEKEFELFQRAFYHKEQKIHAESSMNE